MAATLRSALAPTFSWTTGTTDLILTFASGTSPVNVALPTATYRMFLGPSSGTGKDVLRAIETAINGSLAGAVRAETCAASLTTTGRVQLVFTGATTLTAGRPAMYLLGLAGGGSPATTHTGAYGPKYLATFAGHTTSRVWAPKQAVAGAVGLDGRAWLIKSGVRRWETEVTFAPIPRDPTLRASLAANQTAFHPADAQLGSEGAHHAEWSVVDVLEAAGGKTCGLAMGTLQDLIAGTATGYDLVSIDPVSLASIEAERWRERWDAWHSLRLSVIRHASTSSTSPRGTRA